MRRVVLLTFDNFNKIYYEIESNLDLREGETVSVKTANGIAKAVVLQPPVLLESVDNLDASNLLIIEIVGAKVLPEPTVVEEKPAFVHKTEEQYENEIETLKTRLSKLENAMDKVEHNDRNTFNHSNVNNIMNMSNIVSNGSSNSRNYIEEPEEVDHLDNDSLNTRSLGHIDSENNYVDDAHLDDYDNLEQEKLEQERLEQESLEQEKLEQERLEQERLEQERLEQEKLEQERLEQERLASSETIEDVVEEVEGTYSADSEEDLFITEEEYKDDNTLNLSSINFNNFQNTSGEEDLTSIENEEDYVFESTQSLNDDGEIEIETNNDKLKLVDIKTDDDDDVNTVSLSNFIEEEDSNVVEVEYFDDMSNEDDDIEIEDLDDNLSTSAITSLISEPNENENNVFSSFEDESETTLSQDELENNLNSEIPETVFESYSDVTDNDFSDLEQQVDNSMNENDEKISLNEVETPPLVSTYDSDSYASEIRVGSSFIEEDETEDVLISGKSLDVAIQSTGVVVQTEEEKREALAEKAKIEAEKNQYVNSNVPIKKRPFMKLDDEKIEISESGSRYIPIKTPDDLKRIDEDLHASYKLYCDIDLTKESFKPLALFKEFNGIFDGAGFSIIGLNKVDNLYVNSHIGLFARSNGIIRNVNFTNVHFDITNTNYLIGGVVVGDNLGTIENVKIDGYVCFNSEKRFTNVGMIAGQNLGLISRCVTKGEIVSTSEEVFLGGICGDNLGRVENSFSIASVVGKRNAIIGGLSGQNSEAISNCYFAGKLDATSKEVAVAASIVGNAKDGFISNCFSFTNITVAGKYAKVGPIVGTAEEYAVVQNSYTLKKTELKSSDVKKNVKVFKSDSIKPISEKKVIRKNFFGAILKWDSKIWDYENLTIPFPQFK